MRLALMVLAALAIMGLLLQEIILQEQVVVDLEGWGTVDPETGEFKPLGRATWAG